MCAEISCPLKIILFREVFGSLIFSLSENLASKHQFLHPPAIPPLVLSLELYWVLPFYSRISTYSKNAILFSREIPKVMVLKTGVSPCPQRVGKHTNFNLNLFLPDINFRCIPFLLCSLCSKIERERFENL